MDNISHSLIGVLTAEAALAVIERKNPEPGASKKLRVSLWLAAVIGSNLPDADIVLAWGLKPRTLQYLIQHRGYTHTFLLTPLMATFVTGAFGLVAKLKNLVYSLREYLLIFIVALLGLVLHILMDGLNTYGFHPLWPYNNQWYFGDSLFIVEPWIWLTLIPLGFFASHHKILRAMHVSLWIAGLALIWFSHFVPPAIAIGMTLWGTVLSLQMRVSQRMTRVKLGVFGLTLIIGVFATVSHWLKKDIREKFAKEQPGVILQDVMLSPLPSNPFCWNVICLESYATRSTYRLRRGMLGILPNIYSPADCMRLYLRKKTNAEPEDRVIWTTDLKFSREELLDMRRRSCLVSAQLKFLRAPFWRREGKRVTLSDMRFDMNRRGNFTTIEVDPENKECPDWVPNWVEPRMDLIRD